MKLLALCLAALCGGCFDDPLTLKQAMAMPCLESAYEMRHVNIVHCEHPLHRLVKEVWKESGEMAICRCSKTSDPDDDKFSR